MESLTASPTRTIVVTDPSGKTTEVTQTETSLEWQRSMK